MNKKIFFAIACLMFFLSGCTNNSNKTNDKIIKVGTTAQSFPNSYNENGKLIGYDVEVINEIAKKNGYKIDWVVTDFSGLMGQLDRGMVDTVANQVVITKDRSSKYKFSIPYSYGGITIVTNPENNFSSLKEMKGKVVGGVLGSQNVEALQAFDSEIQVKMYETRESAWNDVVMNRVDGYVNIKSNLIANMKQTNVSLKFVGEPFSYQDIAFPFQNNENGNRLKQEFDEAIQELQNDNSLSKLSSNYFEGNDISVKEDTSMFFDTSFFITVFSKLFSYFPLTLALTMLSVIISIVIALLIAIIMIEKPFILYQLSKVYVSFFRAVPTLVQLFLFYYGLPQLITPLQGISPLVTVIIGLSFKQAAFLSEIFRAAIISVDSGQKEAAITVGLNAFQAFQRIIFPQAFRNALPGLGNTIITTLKETSLAFTLGVVEMFAQGKILAASSFKYMETYLALAMIYWAVVVVYTHLQSRLEKFLDKPYIKR